MANELVKELEEAEGILATELAETYVDGTALIQLHCVEAEKIQSTLQRAREALTWRERAICFMASSLLEQAETREPVIGAKGDMVFKTLGILAARNFEEAKAPVYFETIADTLTEIARAYTPEEK